MHCLAQSSSYRSAEALSIGVHRGETIETVISLAETLVPEEWLIAGAALPTEKAGCFGSGGAFASLPSRVTISDIVGLSAGSSCTQSSPIWMNLCISDVVSDSSNEGSTSSSSFPSFHSLQTCNKSHLRWEVGIEESFWYNLEEENYIC